ncbi:hypothetical protein [Salinimicrobium flavum]
MYAYQFVSAVYEDFYGEGVIDVNQLIYLAPFFIVILSLVYLIRIKIFDRVYGIDLSELERENISPFSPLSDKEYQEIKSFREEEEHTSEEIKEDYYVRL